MPAKVMDGSDTPPASFEQGRQQSSGAGDRMSQSHPSQPPPSYSFPTRSTSTSRERTMSPFSDESSELPPIQSLPPFCDPSQQHLPSISTVTDPVKSPFSSPSAEPQLPPNHWPSLNPLTAYYTPGHVDGDSAPPLQMDVDSTSTSTAVSVASPDRFTDGRASSVSLDDPDVRLAAEALGDLRADFVSSPPARLINVPSTSATPPATSEPLLSLLTTSHPLLAKTIEGTTLAYNSSKNFSPRFKSGAEYVEGYLAPLGSTLGSVGRATGVEGGVRWVLTAGRRNRQPSASEQNASNVSSHKRRRVGVAGPAASKFSVLPSRSEATGESDPLGLGDERRLSMSTVETLPAYDDLRSPAYTESAEGTRQSSGSGTGGAGHGQNDSSSTAWQSKLIMSTSGLSIAMSEESLRSLKYCLNWLRWGNDHTRCGISALKAALDQFDSADAQKLESLSISQNGDAESSEHQSNAAASESTERSELVARIAVLRGDLLRTLRGVIDTVSKYAGGALPDNARVLVHRHLTSLPQRFRLASQPGASSSVTGRAASDAEVREGAQRVLVLAKEGLDMMAQVSGVLDGTIVSAEEWCERLGKKRRAESDDATAAGEPSAIPSDVATDDAMQQ